ncbi:hypothetical protein [Ramlibacter sp. PS4R-6]|uniref:hypothetical protein n=1 Tax=Ramlibacter sp. PS4R-6 TaxID=3133438 RepID=UPI00309D8240
MGTIILVAGLHKTGTTSIQRVCAANKDALQEAGYIFPVGKMGTSRAAPANHTSLFHFVFRRDPHKWGPGVLAPEPDEDFAATQLSTRAALAAKLARTRRNIIFVAEGVSVFDREELDRMKDWFGEAGWTVQAICLVRHLSSWLHSMVAQRVSAGPRLPLDVVVQEFVQQGSLVRGRIQNLRATFPDTRFLSYEAAARHPQGPAGQFLDVLGIPAATANFPATDVAANQRASDAAVRFLSRLNTRTLSKRGYGRLLDERTLAAIRGVGRGKFVLREAEAPQLNPLLQAENAWLRSELGDAFAQNDPRLEPAPFTFERQDVESFLAVAESAPAHWRPLLREVASGLR